MSRTPRLMLAGVFVALFAIAGWSSPADASTPSPLARIWVANLGSGTIEVGVERVQGESIHRETLALGPGDSLELRRSPNEAIGIAQQRDLLLVTAGWDFDPATLAIEELPNRVQRSRSESRLRDGGAAAGGTAPGDGARVENGRVVSSSAFWVGTEPRTLSLGLRGDRSWGEVRVKTPDGAILGYVTLGASRNVKVTVDFGPLLDANGYRGIVNREIASHSGEVIAYAGQASSPSRESGGRLRRVTAAAIDGTGYFNYNINWSHTPPLEYYVEDGPANTCGEANVERNGTWHFTPNWLCTDANGYAKKGPWYWSNQTADERAQAFMRWPNNDTTTTDWHIWDVSCPSISPASYCQGSSPGCWEGFASDPPYGACFSSSWSRVYSFFAHVDTSGNSLDYWSPFTGSYGSGYTEVTGTLHGLTSCSQNCSCGLDWSTSFPDSGDHTPGQRYRWNVCTTDGGCTSCFQHDFTY